MSSGRGPAATSPPPTDQVVIYDSSKPTRDPRLTDLVGANKIDPALEKQILDRVFGGRYLRDPDKCRFVAQDLAGARQAGDFAPRVSQVAIGSFTAARARQSLYLILNGECGASHADNWGSITLAVFEPDAIVVARATVQGGTSIRGLFDLDADGRDELLMTSGYSNMGETTEGAELSEFQGSKLVSLKAFGKVYEDNCASIAEPKVEESQRIVAARVVGGRPQFSAEKQRRPCR